MNLEEIYKEYRRGNILKEDDQLKFFESENGNFYLDEDKLYPSNNIFDKDNKEIYEEYFDFNIDELTSGELVIEPATLYPDKEVEKGTIKPKEKTVVIEESMSREDQIKGFTELKLNELEKINNEVDINNYITKLIEQIATNEPIELNESNKIDISSKDNKLEVLESLYNNMKNEVDKKAIIEIINTKTDILDAELIADFNNFINNKSQDAETIAENIDVTVEEINEETRNVDPATIDGEPIINNTEEGPAITQYKKDTIELKSKLNELEKLEELISKTEKEIEEKKAENPAIDLTEIEESLIQTKKRVEELKKELGIEETNKEIINIEEYFDKLKKNEIIEKNINDLKIQKEDLVNELNTTILRYNKAVKNGFNGMINPDEEPFELNQQIKKLEEQIKNIDNQIIEQENSKEDIENFIESINNSVITNKEEFIENLNKYSDTQKEKENLEIEKENLLQELKSLDERLDKAFRDASLMLPSENAYELNQQKKIIEDRLSEIETNIKEKEDILNDLENYLKENNKIVGNNKEKIKETIKKRENNIVEYYKAAKEISDLDKDLKKGEKKLEDEEIKNRIENIKNNISKLPEELKKELEEKLEKVLTPEKEIDNKPIKKRGKVKQKLHDLKEWYKKHPVLGTIAIGLALLVTVPTVLSGVMMINSTLFSVLGGAGPVCEALHGVNLALSKLAGLGMFEYVEASGLYTLGGAAGALPLYSAVGAKLTTAALALGGIGKLVSKKIGKKKNKEDLVIGPLDKEQEELFKDSELVADLDGKEGSGKLLATEDASDKQIDKAAKYLFKNCKSKGTYVVSTKLAKEKIEEFNKKKENPEKEETKTETKDEEKELLLQLKEQVAQLIEEKKQDKEQISQLIEERKQDKEQIAQLTEQNKALLEQLTQTQSGPALG